MSWGVFFALLLGSGLTLLGTWWYQRLNEDRDRRRRAMQRRDRLAAVYEHAMVVLSTAFEASKRGSKLEQPDHQAVIAALTFWSTNRIRNQWASAWATLQESDSPGRNYHAEALKVAELMREHLDGIYPIE